MALVVQSFGIYGKDGPSLISNPPFGNYPSSADDYFSVYGRRGVVVGSGSSNSMYNEYPLPGNPYGGPSTIKSGYGTWNGTQATQVLFHSAFKLIVHSIMLTFYDNQTNNFDTVFGRATPTAVMATGSIAASTLGHFVLYNALFWNDAVTQMDPGSNPGPFAYTYAAYGI
jgi:hypothetical protein